MINKKRSSVSKNSNSLNAMIKKTSMTISHNDYTNMRKFLAISLAAIMVFGSFSLGSLTAENSAFGAKPENAGKNEKNVIEWSNGAPSGAHHNLIIHGKKLDYNCDPSSGGGSVFTPKYSAETNEAQKIEFVSNQKSKVENLTALDPCTNHYDGDDAQVQIPYEEEGYYVFWSLKGKPDNGKNQDESNFALAGPIINHICNVTEASSLVKEGDSDFGDLLKNFTLNVQHEDTGSTPSIFDIGETVYHDKDTSGNVTALDMRLANAGNWTFVDGTEVQMIDADYGQDLEPFVNGTEMYRDTDGSMNYTIGEPIYEDSDMSGNVTSGDVRLFVKDGSEALSCSDEDLINGAGAITDKEAFKEKNGKLERFDNTSTSKGKGKSTFVDMTGLFQWSGAVCDATILDNGTINTLDDGQISIEDFDPDGELTPGDIDALGFGTADTLNDIVKPAEDAAIANGQIGSNGVIDTEKEFAAFMEIVFGSDFSCQAIYDEWVFNLAQIVSVGLEVINDGGTTVQVRFYPVATTEFTPVP
jgi:hypothetical protein